MFRIIRDEEEARLFFDAGLLWWVSKEDGADADIMHTRPVIRFNAAPPTWARLGVLGIRLEE